MINFIVVGVLILILGWAIRYMVKEKKKGTVCIGCPNAESCSGRGKSDSGCQEH